MTQDSSIWGTIGLDPGKTVHLETGPLSVWIRKQKDEIWLGHLYEKDFPDNYNPGTTPPEQLEWSRWALTLPADNLEITPVFPDLPIVVHSEYPLKLAQNAKIQIFTRVPVWLRIRSPQNDFILKEIPTVWLSKTWFGSSLEGELCYWLSTKARRSLEEVELKNYVVNCPIWITNKSLEELNFEKFCFRVERLSIYARQDDLWADETNIVYHGEEQNSDITMTGRLPEDITKSTKVAEPRNPLKRSFATRTFKKLFDDSIFSGR